MDGWMDGWTNGTSWMCNCLTASRLPNSADAFMVSGASRALTSVGTRSAAMFLSSRTIATASFIPHNRSAGTWEVEEIGFQSRVQDTRIHT